VKSGKEKKKDMKVEHEISDQRPETEKRLGIKKESKNQSKRCSTWHCESCLGLRLLFGCSQGSSKGTRFLPSRHLKGEKKGGNSSELSELDQLFEVLKQNEC